MRSATAPGTWPGTSSLIAKNGDERVQRGPIRFMVAFGTSLLIRTTTVEGVRPLGGAAGRRTTTIVHALAVLGRLGMAGAGYPGNVPSSSATRR